MTLDINDKYFTSSVQNEIVTISIDFNLFLESETYEHKELLLDLLDAVDKSDDINVLVIHNMHHRFSLDEYRVKWNMLLHKIDYESSILRVFRTFDQLFVKLKELKKVVLSIGICPSNVMIYNLFMAADVKFITSDFYIDNSNLNMVNIPKGGAIHSKANLARINPIKLLFYSDKVLAPELHQKHLADEVFNPEDVMERVLLVANRYCKLSFAEIEAVKVLEYKKVKEYEVALQKENGFLLSCIRRMKNRN